MKIYWQNTTQIFGVLTKRVNYQGRILESTLNIERRALFKSGLNKAVSQNLLLGIK